MQYGEAKSTKCQATHPEGHRDFVGVVAHDTRTSSLSTAERHIRWKETESAIAAEGEREKRRLTRSLPFHCVLFF
jgi:hypothetical protein